MKKLLISLIVLVLLISASCQQKIDTEKEKEKIKTVIEGVLKAHAESDYDSWINAWVDQPYVFLSYTYNKGHFLWEGRDNMYNIIKESFTQQKKTDIEKGRSLSLEGYDYFIKVYKESAWATFKIRWKAVYEGKEKIEQWETFENYTFEKLNEEWKIASVNAVQISSYKKDVTESEDVKEE
jgi:hypothetical protein